MFPSTNLLDGARALSAPTDHRVTTTDELSRYGRWIDLVNRAIDRRCGLIADDLPDCPYRDWFEQGIPAESAAKRAIRRAMC